MARYSFALRGDPIDEDHEIRIQEKQIDILNEKEQLLEHYLCDINPAGEVPVLAPVNSKNTIPDSVEITKYMARSYPTLIPGSHDKKILQLLSELHRISFFSLTFAGKPQGQLASKAYLQGRLNDQISERYRAAIKYKIERIEQTKLGPLELERSEKNEVYAKQLMAKFRELLDNSQTGWLFNFDKPSALDAHLVVFIARMMDINRGDLVPEALKGYAAKAMNGTEWKEVMQGRTTRPPTA